ncbi:serine hydrolase [Acuticoccus sp. MNP-M23]|uniref:D-alanyl-D-alanine carboxypeptidase family protein n=1 Tax=Acuticoccus sp. MNP-M23 TaxID=3072793 RepID=UPI002814D7B9|nr:serine hydrolase [Acuticoccus sp. MNP-M23]WMS43259.1 serine hydrolase [Acuticoccus sp. MNP-M23]
MRGGRAKRAFLRWRERGARSALRILCIVAVCLVPLSAVRAEIGAYLLFDMADGKVLAKHRASTPWYPASLTKLMTAYVTFKAIEADTLAMTSPVRISPQASQQPPSRMGFKVGTVITVETALRIILTKSANDVSVALAEAVSGSSGRFIDAMNKTAAEIGMASSSFDNPHGLPNTRQIITARDMAVLMMALQNDFPQYADYFEMGGVQLGKKRMRNHNNLMRKFRGTDGMKTGFICASGFNLAATVTRDGLRLGAVVLGGTTSRERDERTAELLAKGFEAVANGGAINLNGFGNMDAPMAFAPVTGTRPDLGTVEALPAASEPVVDIRSTVCGARRPATRYDKGVHAGLDAFMAQREAVLAWQKNRNARDDAIRKALETPRVPPAGDAPSDAKPEATEAADAVIAPEDAAPRALAGNGLVPAAWTSPSPVTFPLARPVRAEPAAARSELAPDDWVPSRAVPPANPLDDKLRGPLPPRPDAQPLSYLQPVRAMPMVKIALGGADESRPNPLSGTVIGGGLAPRPRPKPVIPVDVGSVSFTPIEPSITETAIEVREAASAPN